MRWRQVHSELTKCKWLEHQCQFWSTYGFNYGYSGQACLYNKVGCVLLTRAYWKERVMLFKIYSALKFLTLTEWCLSVRQELAVVNCSEGRHFVICLLCTPLRGEKSWDHKSPTAGAAHQGAVSENHTEVTCPSLYFADLNHAAPVLNIHASHCLLAVGLCSVLSVVVRGNTLRKCQHVHWLFL